MRLIKRGFLRVGGVLDDKVSKGKITAGFFSRDNFAFGGSDMNVRSENKYIRVILRRKG